MAVVVTLSVSAFSFVYDAFAGRTQAGQEPWQDTSNQFASLVFAGSSQSVMLAGNWLQSHDPTIGITLYAPGPSFFERLSRTAMPASGAFDSSGIEQLLKKMTHERRPERTLISNDVILQRLVEHHRRKQTV